MSTSPLTLFLILLRLCTQRGCCRKNCPSPRDPWFGVLALCCFFPPVTADIPRSQAIQEVQEWLKESKDKLKGGDATLYAPEYNGPCCNTILHCYFLELEVLMYEQNLTDTDKLTEDDNDFVHVMKSLWNYEVSQSRTATAWHARNMKWPIPPSSCRGFYPQRRLWQRGRTAC